MLRHACRHRASRPQIELELSRTALHQALGPTGMPATLTFTFNALIVVTPSGNVRIAAHTVATAGAGTHNAGLRPVDADVLRDATEGPDGTVILAADALSLTLNHAGMTVSTGRW